MATMASACMPCSEHGQSRLKCALCGEALSSDHAATLHFRDRHGNGKAQLVRVSATTLERNRHGLFDREAPPDQQHHQSMVIPLQPAGPSLQFIREGSEVRLHQGRPSALSQSASSPLHTQIAWRRASGASGNSFAMPVVERTPKSASCASASRRVMWLGVGASGHALKEGELIKLGTFTLSVRQVVLAGPAQVPSFSSHRDPETAMVRQEARSPGGSALTCRICLGGPSDEDDEDEEDLGPLILAPCLCKGDVRRVHLSCLRQWLKVRYSVENRLAAEGAVAYSFKPPGCEICRTEFPSTCQDLTDPDSEPIPLLTNLPLVEPPFIVLSVPKSNGEDRERPHGERCVFAPNGKQDMVLKIGRQRGAELRLNDSSVSRVHATIRFKDGQFLLHDNNARFRTLVLPTGPEPLHGARQEPLSVQAGRTLLSFALLEDSESTPAGSVLPVDIPPIANVSSSAAGVSGASDSEEPAVEPAERVEASVSSWC